MPEKTLVVAIADAPATLDPHKAEDLIAFDVLSQTVEGLTRFADSSLHVEPCLASKWSAENGFTRWTFKIRSDVRFSDGTPLTPEGVVQSFRSAKDFGGQIELAPPEGVRFVLREPSSSLPDLLAQPYFSVALPSENAMLPRTTGPYFVESMKPSGREIVLRRNEKCTRVVPKIDRIVFRVQPFVTLLPKALSEGTVDVTDAITPSILPIFRGLSGVRVESQMGLDTGFLAFNCERGIFADARVRRAAAIAIDKKTTLVKHFPPGMGEVAISFLPPALAPAGLTEPLPFDADGAKKLLADAGYRGDRVRLLPCWAPRPYMPDPTAIAGEVAGQLARAGFRVEVEPLAPADVYFSRQSSGDFDVVLGGWIADDTIAANFLFENFASASIGKNNVARFRSAPLDRLLQEARGLDARAAAPVVRRILDILDREVPVVPLFHGPLLAAANQSVVGQLLHPSLALRLWTLDKK